jgi:uncharacterized phage protein (TIGR01671 family)
MIIKFRGKTIKGEWCYGNLSILKQRLDDVDAGYYISNEIGMPFAFKVIPKTVGQFTGIIDRNKKEIYKDDIVKIKHRYDDLGIVLWDIHGCWITNKRDLNTCFRLNVTSADEVVGNIHDNTELLKCI